MGLLGFLIFASIIVAIIFGWDYMVDSWKYIFDMLSRLFEALIGYLEGNLSSQYEIKIYQEGI